MIESKLFNQEVTIYKFEPATTIKGRHQDGQLITIKRAKASIQPISGRDVVNYPEGKLNNVRFKIYISDAEELTIHDKIKFDGQLYQVLVDNTWSKAPFLNHSKFYLAPSV